MAITKRTAFIFLCIWGMACEEPYQAQLNSVPQDLIVVEGTMTSENVGQKIRLSRPILVQNETPEPVTGATLTITEQDNVYALSESPPGSGLYYTQPMRAITGKKYMLSIQFEGKIYSAQDSAVAVENMGPLAYHAVNDQYELTFASSGQNPNFIRHDISWTGMPCTSGSCNAEIVFYDLKSIDVNDIYKPGKAPFTIPAGSIVVRTKYSVSPLYRSYLRAVLSETEWRGGVFDVQRANVPTNLSEGAVGFFGVSTVVSDTTVVE